MSYNYKSVYIYISALVCIYIYSTLKIAVYFPLYQTATTNAFAPECRSLCSVRCQICLQKLQHHFMATWAAGQHHYALAVI